MGETTQEALHAVSLRMGLEGASFSWGRRRFLGGGAVAKSGIEDDARCIGVLFRERDWNVTWSVIGKRLKVCGMDSRSNAIMVVATPTPR